MKWGKQTFYCRACGNKMITSISAIYGAQVCNKECWDLYKIRETRSILGENEQCNFIPPTPGYRACTRDKGHEGPCAHEYQTSMDVHTEHCCEEHRVCKYGKEETCSVATGKKKASFPCNC